MKIFHKLVVVVAVVGTTLAMPAMADKRDGYRANSQRSHVSHRQPKASHRAAHRQSKRAAKWQGSRDYRHGVRGRHFKQHRRHRNAHRSYRQKQYRVNRHRRAGHGPYYRGNRYRPDHWRPYRPYPGRAHWRSGVRVGVWFDGIGINYYDH